MIMKDLCGQYGHLLSFAIEETVCPVAIAKFGAFWTALDTDWHGMGTTGMKAAPGRWIDETGRLASSNVVYLTHVYL